MSLSSTANKAVYNGNGATTVWPFAFPVLEAAHLAVILTDEAGNEATLAPQAYSVSGIGAAAGGSVTYPLSGSPVASGAKLTLLRTVPYVQGTVLSNQGGYFPEVLEARLDQIYMALQQHEERIGRAIVAAATDAVAEMVLPVADYRAGKVLAFDGDGDVIPSTLTLAELEAQPSGAAGSAAAAAVSAASAVSSATAAAISATSAASLAAGIVGTSASSLAIGLGSKGLVTQAGKQFAVGAHVVVAATATPSTNWMFGQVTAYDGGSGALTVNVGALGGSGTIAAWTVTLAGMHGVAGTAGATWSSGTTAPSGGADGDFYFKTDDGEFHKKVAGVWTPQFTLPLTRNYLTGLEFSTAGSSSTFSISAGSAMDGTNTRMMRLAAAISKTTGSWTVGNGNGALDTGTIANSTWYHAFEIMRPDTGVVDVLISLSATAPTLPANYTLFRHIFPLQTDGSGNWVKTRQVGDYFYRASVIDFSTASTTPMTLRTLSIPTGIVVQPIVSAVVGSTSFGAISIAPASDSSLSHVLTAGAFGGGQVASSLEVGPPSNTGGQIYVETSAPGAFAINLYTAGWFYRRGKDG
jgi:hypothetical protein